MIVISHILQDKIKNLKVLIKGKAFSKKELEEKAIQEIVNCAKEGKVSMRSLCDKYKLNYTSLYYFLKRTRPDLIVKNSQNVTGYTIIKGSPICPSCNTKTKYAREDRLKKIYYFCRNEKCKDYQPVKKFKKMTPEEQIEICRKYYNLIPMKKIKEEHGCSYFNIRKCIKNYTDIVIHSKES